MTYILILIVMILIALCVTVCVVGTHIQIEIEMARKAVTESLTKIQLIAVRSSTEGKVFYIEAAKTLRVMKKVQIEVAKTLCVIEEMQVEGHFARALKQSKRMSKIQKSSFSQRWKTSKQGGQSVIQRTDDN